MTDPKARNAWHALSGEEAVQRLESGPRGIARDEAQRRLKSMGPNRLPRSKRPGWITILLRQFANPLVLLLIAATFVSLAIGEIADAVFIGAVLLFNAAVGAVQEKGAESSAAALDSYLESQVRVLRPQGEERLPASQLVPGDMVALESGDAVPADLRLLDSRQLSIDESLLSGESLPVTKEAGSVLPTDTGLSDRRNLAFAGTAVNAGRALGLVVATGLSTEIGRISGALAGGPDEAPPLVLRIKRFTRLLSVASVVIVAAIGLADYARGAALVEVFVTAVALAVAAIPEGLPIAITVALSVASRRMAGRDVIVRALPAVEGLGACTLIASDKTGTLTQNRLTLGAVSLPGRELLDPSAADAAADPPLARLLRAGLLCNDAQPSGEDYIGDAVDRAFLWSANRQGLDIEAERRDHPRRHAIAYEPERRFQATFHEEPGPQEALLAVVKGAAEVVLPNCRDLPADAQAEADALAARGLRVIALAEGKVPREDALTAEQMPEGLTLLGFAGLSDPLRPDSKDAVAACRAAGVKVVMVTGDHPRTALAIARELGLDAGEEDAGEESVVTGADIARLDPEALSRRIASAQVFARVEPLQKLTIVESMMQSGHFVAVTGDGVNDAPALRAANIGVAMGRSGTDVARSAADLILTDDAFSSIADGIEQGRIAYDNVRRVTLFLLAMGVAEIVLFTLALMLGMPLPLFAVQLLWLNLVTNGIQDMALALEKGEPDALKRPPRPPSEPLFDRRMGEQVLLAGVYMGLCALAVYGAGRAWGWGEAETHSATLLLLVLFGNMHALNCRSERRSVFRLPLRQNPLLIGSILGALALHLGSAWIPGLNAILGVLPPAPEILILLLPLAVGLVVLMEGYKRLRA